MKKWLAFEVRSDGTDQLDNFHWNWEVTSQFKTKKEVMDHYNSKRCLRKVRKVYTLKELLTTYGKERTKQILEKTKPFWINECNN